MRGGAPCRRRPIGPLMATFSIRPAAGSTPFLFCLPKREMGEREKGTPSKAPIGLPAQSVPCGARKFPAGANSHVPVLRHTRAPSQRRVHRTREATSWGIPGNFLRSSAPLAGTRSRLNPASCLVDVVACGVRSVEPRAERDSLGPQATARGALVRAMEGPLRQAT